MGTPDKKLSELVGIIKAWIPQKTKTKPQNVSRDFWMPDQSCRVCYECDSQFTIFNRKHHCRLCGRVFCAKCTANSIPAQSDEPGTGLEDGERIRVCNYCFKQWEQAVSTVDNGAHAPTPGLSPSPSATSLASTKSRSTCQSSSSTVGSTSYATGPFQCLPYNPVSSHQFAQMDLVEVDQEIRNSARNINLSAAVEGSSSKQFGYCFDS